jgi:hypothetical protein
MILAQVSAYRRCWPDLLLSSPPRERDSRSDDPLSSSFGGRRTIFTWPSPLEIGNACKITFNRLPTGA